MNNLQLPLIRRSAPAIAATCDVATGCTLPPAYRRPQCRLLLNGERSYREQAGKADRHDHGRLAGMLAIALGLGADARFRQPMALAVSGGLLNSTALSLLVVPVVFSLLSDFEQANDHSDPGRIRTLWRG